eukprot:TRINITY_DN4311_c1_g1_i1.p2 TRINITY_DN4311_c1_g1~~TRINITY_DN4311_c1_g1_i1.p2  ORF type:complete len:211 (+),score=-12.69 TRINITY_DN4311_c1_g1_i1:1306-1938(+)
MISKFLYFPYFYLQKTIKEILTSNLCNKENFKLQQAKQYHYDTCFKRRTQRKILKEITTFIIKCTPNIKMILKVNLNRGIKMLPQKPYQTRQLLQTRHVLKFIQYIQYNTIKKAYNPKILQQITKQKENYNTKGYECRNHYIYIYVQAFIEEYIISLQYTIIILFQVQTIFFSQVDILLAYRITTFVSRYEQKAMFKRYFMSLRPPVLLL